jgi:hypothetical protein
MENEFINYEQALALKELGFDEECFGLYNPIFHIQNYTKNSIIDNLTDNKKLVCSAPLYQQAFRWFRDEHNILVDVYPYKNGWLYKIYDNEDGNYDGVFTSFREAEIACLEYLIGFVDFCSYL